jgi:hypothetical protein
VPQYVLVCARDNAATAADMQQPPIGVQIETAVTALPDAC